MLLSESFLDPQDVHFFGSICVIPLVKKNGICCKNSMGRRQIFPTLSTVMVCSWCLSILQFRQGFLDNVLIYLESSHSRQISCSSLLIAQPARILIMDNSVRHIVLQILTIFQLRCISVIFT